MLLDHFFTYRLDFQLLCYYITYTYHLLFLHGTEVQI